MPRHADTPGSPRQLQGSQGAGTPSSYGFDPDERSDRPDAIHERRENEPPEGEG